MAEPFPLPAAPPVLPSSDDEPVAVRPIDEAYSKELREKLYNEFLPNYSPGLVITNHVDELRGRYRINIQKPLSYLDSATAKAYEVIDSETKDRKLYALVCSNHLPPRKELAQLLLKNQNENNLIRLLAEGIVKISALNEERYTLVYEQPQGKTLHDVIYAQPQAFSDTFVRNKIIKPLHKALNFLAEMGYSHGRVNPHNIYIDKDTFTLGECCSEPCGYSQDFHFKPIAYTQAHPAGHGGGSRTVDYYALGSIVALMKLKPKAMQIKNKDMFLRRLLQEGSYIGVVGYIDLSDEMNDLLRGTLNDNPNDRWGAEHVGPWCGGKRYNLLTPNIPSLGGRPFEVDGQSFNNLRQLAQGLRSLWAKVIPHLQDHSLGRWVELSTRRREISEYINKIVKSYRTINPEVINEIMTRTLFALDQAAPIHLKHVSMHPDGTSILFADLYHHKEQDYLDEIRTAIQNSVFSSWQEAQRIIFNNHNLPSRIQQSVWALDRARLHINNKNMGFGIERTLYEINPDLPCQSEILKKHYVTNITDLLVALDHISKSEDRPDYPIDRHIAAFISAKLPLNNLVTFSEYGHNPELSKHLGLLALKFLQKSQKNAKNIKVPGLTAWIIASITDVIGAFHSDTLRKELCQQLPEIAKGGDLNVLLGYLTAYDYGVADAQAYANAIAQYADFENKIIGLKDETLLEFRAYRSGNTIAKSIAFTIFIVVCFYFFGGEA